jgi:hypothetical protein
MESIEKYYNLVEKVISKLGVDPSTCRGEKSGQWNLVKGSASIWADVWKLEDKDYGYIQIMGPVCDIPDNKKLEFYEEVMEINHNLYSCALTKFKERIYVKSIRELDGLDETEVDAMFDRIGYYADYYDDYFKDKYFPAEGRRKSD